MKHHLTFLVLLAAAAAVSPAAADTSEDALSREADAEHAAGTVFSVKTRSLVAADPRVAPLVAELRKASAIKDKAARKAQLDALGPRILGVRNEVAKKAGLDAAEVGRKLAPLGGPSIRRVPLAPMPSGMKLGEVTVTSFPKTWSFKYKCTDAGDHWDFDGSKVHVYAESAIADKDCLKIFAGRGAVVKIPAGAKKVTVQVAASIDLDVVASSFGAFGEASGVFGVRFHLVQGAFGSTPQGTLTSQMKGLIHVHTKNAFPNPIPVGLDGFADTLQEGDSGTLTSVDLPPNPGSELEVSLYTGGKVDADLQGYASVNNDMTPKSMKITFTN